MEDRRIGAKLVPLHEQLFGKVRLILLSLLGVAALLVLAGLYRVTAVLPGPSGGALG
ncbi:hypothetical protein [Archangium sp.]|uniref:hypothetical protein n=1 Tax=Archangium sp. TaxID=1872627 RepID=UPI00389A91FD